jgi:hypothetical protein
MPKPKDGSSQPPDRETIFGRLDRALPSRKAPSAIEQTRAMNSVDALMKMRDFESCADLRSTIERLKTISGHGVVAKRILTPLIVRLERDYQELVR